MANDLEKLEALLRQHVDLGRQVTAFLEAANELVGDTADHMGLEADLGWLSVYDALITEYGEQVWEAKNAAE